MLPLISGTFNKHKISVSPLYSSLSTPNITLDNTIPLQVHLRFAYFVDSTADKCKS